MDKTLRLAAVAAVALAAVSAFAEPYTRLFKVINPVGECFVRPAGATAFEPAKKDKAYPFGSVVQCGMVGKEESSMALRFSENDGVRLLPGTEVEVIMNEAGSRVVDIKKGLVVTRIGVNTPAGTVMVKTPVGTVVALNGNCKVKVEAVPATPKAQAFNSVELRAEPMSQMKFVGPQFIIPVLKNGFGANILTTADESYTIITDLLGDYQVYVNTGVDPDPDKPVEENEEIQPIKMSTKSALKFWREAAPVGGRRIVSVFATTPSGKGRESFAFAVGSVNVASRTTILFDGATNELAAADSAFPAASPTAAATEDAFGGDDAPASEAAGGDAPAAQETKQSEASSDEGLYDFLF